MLARVMRAALALGLLLCAMLAPLHAREDKQHKQEAVNQAHSAQIEAAKKAASDWLQLVDADKYAESWAQSAPFLQAHVPRAAWEKRMDETRKPLNPFVERTLSTTEYREQLPGLPAGQYVALVWESYFGANHQMLESVIMAANDGTWKPIGYAVQ